MSLLGLDVGTSGCKALVMLTSGEEIAKSARDYTCHTTASGGLELDPELLWHQVFDCLEEVSIKANSLGYPVEAMCIGTMGDSVTAIDKAGQTVMPIILASDTRSKAECSILEQRVGSERLFDITGMPPHPISTITKMMWVKNHMPSVYERIDTFLCCEDFVVGRLTGTPVTSYATACRTMAFDMVNECWSKEIFDAAEIPMQMVAKAAPPGTVIGEVSSEMARRLGFNEHVVVVPGGMDQTLGAFAEGAVRPSIVQNSMGTVETLLTTYPIASLDKRLRQKLLAQKFSVNMHVIRGHALIMGLVLTSGSTINWFRDTFLQGSRKAIIDFSDTIESTPTPALLLPYFSGKGTPDMDSDAVSMYMGINFGTNLHKYLQAIIQGLCHEAYSNITAMKEMGIPIESITCVGGNSLSMPWMQMKADVLGLVVGRSGQRHTVAKGAAMLAGLGIHKWVSVDECLSTCKTEVEFINPRPQYHHIHMQIHELMDKFREAGKPLWNTFNSLSENL